MTGDAAAFSYRVVEGAEQAVFCQYLLLAHVNLCYYRSGGDFLYYVSPAVEFADRLIQTYTGGDCRRLEEHRAVLVPERTVIR